MAGVELCFWIFCFKSLSQSCQFFFSLLTIKQVETTYNGIYWPGTGRQNIFQSAMSTAREQETIDIQGQFVTEIVMDKITVSILHIEIGFHPTFSRHDRIEVSFILFIWLNEKVLIPFGHWMNLRYMCNCIEAFSYLKGLVYQDESVIAYLRPFCSDAVQIPPFRKELTAHGVGRNDDFSLLIAFKKVS